METAPQPQPQELFRGAQPGESCAAAGKTAAQLQVEGTAAFRAERWEAAVRAFECAYALEPKAEHLFNLAASYEHWSEQCRRAAPAYRRYLDACGGCEHRRNAELRLWRLAVECPQSIVLEHQGVTLEHLAIEAEGWGSDRQRAAQDADRQALEAAADTALRDLFLPELTGDKEKIAADIRARVESEADRFLEKHDVLAEWRDGATIKIRARVQIASRALLRALATQVRSLRWARFPKLMLLVKEEYTGRDGQTAAVDEPSLQALLEGEFLARGFELLDREQMTRLRAEERAVFADLVDDDSKAARMAMEHGADYVVMGVARIRHTSFNDLKLEEHHGHIELSLRVLDASTAAVLSSVKHSGVSPPNCFSEADLRIRSVSFAGARPVAELIRGMTARWNDAIENGVDYSITLHGVRAYKSEARDFVELLQGVPGMKEVTERSYGGARLELGVRYTAAYGVEYLSAQILKAASGRKSLAAMDVAHSTQRKLDFRLRPR